MKTNSIKWLWPMAFAIMTWGCNTSVENPKQETPVQEVEEQPNTRAEAAKEALPTIFQKSFQDISPGDLISTHQDRIHKGVLRTGEGDFESYQIQDPTHGPMAYFMPDPKDPKRVGDITINSPIPSTEDGIRVGDTFGKLLVMYSNLEAHGSEIESRTYIFKDNLLFRIDEAHDTYELKLSAISKKAKILEIVIRHQRSPVE